MLWNKKPVHNVTVYVVDIVYEDGTAETVAVTGMFLEILDPVTGATDVVELGNTASDTHPLRGVETNRENSLKLFNYLRSVYSAGFCLYLNPANIRMVRLADMIEYDLGAKIWQAT